MNCKNCNHLLTEKARFCDHCGARVVTEELTYGYLASEVSERFLDVENNLLLRTLKDLFIRPAVVINEYINGTRKRHLNVANYMALAITLAGLQIFLMQKFFAANMDMSWMVGEDNPFAKDSSFIDKIWEFQSLLYVVLIPVYAAIAWLTFLRNKKYSYLHHIVIVAYTQSHLSIIFVIPVLLLLALGVNFFKFVYFFSFPFMIIYTAYCYKKLYQISLWKIIRKTLLFLFIGSILYFGVIIITMIILVVTGVLDLEQINEAQKAKEGLGYIVSSTINWTS